MFISGEYIKGKKTNSFILFFDIQYSGQLYTPHYILYPQYEGVNLYKINFTKSSERILQ